MHEQFSLQQKRSEDPEPAPCTVCDKDGLVWVWVKLKNTKRKVRRQARCDVCKGTKRIS